jgi:hypothetical protein
VEGNHGTGRKPCLHGRADAGGDRDIPRNSAGDRFGYATGRVRGISVPYKSLDLGMGHRVDLGIIGSLARSSGARAGARGPTLGCGFAAGAAASGFALVVIERNRVRVSVIIPTYNEAQAIGRVLADLPPDLATEIIVVDSNSSDGTGEIAAKMGARVLNEPRRGYGRACLTGLANVTAPDIVVFLDGDYSDRPSEVGVLLAPIIEGRADITVGSRLGENRISGALPWHQAFGNRLAAGLITILYGVRITDLGPFRAARADVLRGLALEQATYGWAVEMILKGALQGFRIVEVPVSYCPRIGKSKISGTLTGTVGAAWFILSLILRYYFRRPRAGTPRPA